MVTFCYETEHTVFKKRLSKKNNEQRQRAFQCKSHPSISEVEYKSGVLEVINEHKMVESVNTNSPETENQRAWERKANIREDQRILRVSRRKFVMDRLNANVDTFVCYLVPPPQLVIGEPIRFFGILGNEMSLKKFVHHFIPYRQMEIGEPVRVVGFSNSGMSLKIESGKSCLFCDEGRKWIFCDVFGLSTIEQLGSNYRGARRI